MSGIFKDIEDLRSSNPKIQKSIDPSEIWPYVDDAADLYVSPWISEALYNQIVDQTTADNISAENQTILTKLKKAVANYAVYDASIDLILKLNNHGLQTSQGDNSNRPRMWEYQELKENSLRKGDLFIEQVLDILEANADDFPLWKNSSAYTIHNTYFIRQANELDTIIPLTVTKRVYLKMIPFINQAEQIYIKSILGNPLFDDLKEKWNAQNVSAEEAELINKIRPCLGMYSLYNAAPHIDINTSKDGIRHVKDRTEVKEKTPAESKAFERWLFSLRETAQTFESGLYDFLNDNADNFPLFEVDEDDSTNDRLVYNAPGKSYMI